jgi:ABC-2 type transport system ATP-binding protein
MSQEVTGPAGQVLVGSSRAAQGSAAERSQQSVLACTDLTKRFENRTAVDAVTFHIDPGETYGLLGPNGAGKTTTIRMVCGLLRSDGGTVLVGGRQVGRDAVDAKRSIGFVPQDVALYPDLSARENLRFFGRLAGLHRRELAERIDEVLELIGLTDRAGDRVESFSGGMRRRLNIGAGLIHRPELLVLDEPTVGVDPQSRRAILDSVAALSREGMAVLYTTHYMEEAERICDRMGIIDRGRLIVEGTHRELVSKVAEHDRIELVAQGDDEAFAVACLDLDGIVEATSSQEAVHLLSTDGRRLLPRVLELAEHMDVVVRSVEVAEPDLEAVFLHLTGTALRE